MKNKKKINIFYLAIFSLVFLIKFDFFLNIYLILKNNSESRMVSNYGYCKPLGYGFIKEIIEKHNLNNYNINTKNKIISPSSDIFSYSFTKKESPYKILINYNSNNLKEINKSFMIIENKDKCYLIKYLDD